MKWLKTIIDRPGTRSAPSTIDSVTQLSRLRMVELFRVLLDTGYSTTVAPIPDCYVTYTSTKNALDVYQYRRVSNKLACSRDFVTHYYRHRSCPYKTGYNPSDSTRTPAQWRPPTTPNPDASHRMAHLISQLLSWLLWRVHWNPRGCGSDR